MPTQAELDKESGRSSLRSETMVGSGGKLETRVFSSGSRINQGSTEWGGEAKGAIFDISTNTYTPELDNQQGIDEDTNKRGIDDYEQPPAQEAGGAAGLSGIEIIWADQEETFIPASDFFTDYDPDSPTLDKYWSVVFAVSNNTFTQAAPTYDEVQELWDDVGTAQTKYRLRLITQDKVADPDENVAISVYGQYRESIICVNGDPVTVLVKIS